VCRQALAKRNVIRDHFRHFDSTDVDNVRLDEFGDRDRLVDLGGELLQVRTSCTIEGAGCDVPEAEVGTFGLR